MGFFRAKKKTKKLVILINALITLVMILSSFANAEIHNQVHNQVDIPSTSKKQRFREGELLVKFRENIPENEKQNIHKKANATVIREFKRLRMHHVSVKGLSLEQAMEIYQKNPNIEYAEPNYIVTIDAVPNDPSYTDQWGLKNLNWGIDAPSAWNITTGSPNVVVAVIDSGVDYNHEDLRSNIWTNIAEASGTPGIDDDGNGFVDDIHGIDTFNNDVDPMDDQKHGTHVAGIIGAASNNGIGISGVNWNSRILPCKWIGQEGWGSIDGAIACLEYVKAMKDRGEPVVATNNSWGWLGRGEYLPLRDAIAAQIDVLFVAAAGNDTTDNDEMPYWPANYNLPNVISVAAIDQYGAKSYFSNYGCGTVHIGAPGSLIKSTVLNNGYDYLDGTSMAAPHVTGLAGLLKAKWPTLDVQQTKDRILRGGTNMTAMAGMTKTGKRVNAYGSLTVSQKPIVIEHDIANTNSPVVTLTLDCDNPSGCSKMKFSNDNSNWLPAEDYATTKTWTLTSGDGTKTVYAKLEDSFGNLVASGNDSIYLDTTLPTGTAVINNGAAFSNSTSVTLNLTCNDAKNCTKMKFSNDNFNWSEPEDFASSISWNLAAGDGAKTVYVKFVDGSGNWSAAVSDSITLDTTPLTAPVIVSTTSTGSQGIKIEWTDNNVDESGFSIERKKSTEGIASYIQIGTTGAGNTSFDDTSVLEGTTYNYRVRAYDDHFSPAAYSPYSAVVTSAWSPGPAPTGVAIAAAPSAPPYSIGLTVTWTYTSDNHSGFEIQRMANNSGIWSAVVGVVAANARSWSDRNITGGNNYKYRVRAYYTNPQGIRIGDTAFSAASLNGAQAADADPTNDFAGSGHSISLIFTWNDKTSDEDGFTIQRKVGSSGTWSNLADVGPNQTSYTDYNIKPTNAYYYRVRAYATEGGTTNFSTATPGLWQNPDDIPSDMEVISSPYYPGCLQVKWTDNTYDETRFVIQRRVPGTSWPTDNSYLVWQNSTPGIGSSRSYLDCYHNVGEKYEYRVRGEYRTDIDPTVIIGNTAWSASKIGTVP